ncbi:MAG: hypothetical protein KC476_01075 [Cyanobacteria bacterium HKST-UBA06]|nr:hypothetical protein [Cyanobacteria bacterium HKST-UBA05]MCA9799369.1 hypothetical protein [Cyanobacteria bacterium HKST-UBA04]MCA9806522.1 hypothetical protein [Cyanobacteria bacterium HKST-UBA06]MCA9842630.1 hypothetical protein [Cyanobacteria bacterium HKST-UBA03]
MVLTLIKQMLSVTETTESSTQPVNPYDTTALTRAHLNDLLAKTPKIPANSPLNR